MKIVLTPPIAVTTLLLMTGSLVGQACAQTPAAAPAVDAAYQAILSNPKVVKAIDDIKADDDGALRRAEAHHRNSGAALQGKSSRRIFPEAACQELGFKEASIDAEGNVIALRKGSGGGRPKLVVSAHLDTVFPEGTDVTVKEKGRRHSRAGYRRRLRAVSPRCCR